MKSTNIGLILNSDTRSIRKMVRLANCRIRKVIMVNSVQRLCWNIPDYSGAGLSRFHCSHKISLAIITKIKKTADD